MHQEIKVRTCFPDVASRVRRWSIICCLSLRCMDGERAEFHFSKEGSWAWRDVSEHAEENEQEGQKY